MVLQGGSKIEKKLNCIATELQTPTSILPALPLFWSNYTASIPSSQKAHIDALFQMTGCYFHH